MIGVEASMGRHIPLTRGREDKLVVFNVRNPWAPLDYVKISRDGLLRIGKRRYIVNVPGVLYVSKEQTIINDGLNAYLIDFRKRKVFEVEYVDNPNAENSTIRIKRVVLDGVPYSIVRSPRGYYKVNFDFVKFGNRRITVEFWYYPDIKRPIFNKRVMYRSATSDELFVPFMYTLLTVVENYNKFPTRTFLFDSVPHIIKYETKDILQTIEGDVLTTKIKNIFRRWGLNITLTKLERILNFDGIWVYSVKWRNNRPVRGIWRRNLKDALIYWSRDVANSYEKYVKLYSNGTYWVSDDWVDNKIKDIKYNTFLFVLGRKFKRRPIPVYKKKNLHPFEEDYCRKMAEMGDKRCWWKLYGKQWLEKKRIEKQKRYFAFFS